MDNEKPKYLYRGVTVTEDILKTEPIFGVDLYPPNPPKYDSQGRKTVGDGNEYGVYMSDNKDVATGAYAFVSINDGTSLNKNIRIGGNLKIAIPAVGIVYKISTDGLDIRKPWIKSSLTGHYNNGYRGNEWIAEKIPVKNYVVEQVTIGEDILHPNKIIAFDKQDEILLKINLELEERRKRLERFEKFIESLPHNQVRNMSSEDLRVYKEIYKKDGLIETDLETFKISDFSDFLKLIMAYYYQTNPSSLPMYELKYLIALQSFPNLTFSNFKKKLLNDIKDFTEKSNNIIEKQKLSGNEVKKRPYNNSIKALSKMYNIYHTLMLKQVTMMTGITFNNDFDSSDDIRKKEATIFQKLEEMYYNGEISLRLYQALKIEIYEEADNIVSLHKPKNNKVEDNHLHHHR